MLMYHRGHQADMTVAVSQYGIAVPYGVVECDGPSICRLQEKPQLNVLVNAGIYLLEPSVYGFVVNGEALQMTDLITRLLDAGRPSSASPSSNSGSTSGSTPTTRGRRPSCRTKEPS